MLSPRGRADSSDGDVSGMWSAGMQICHLGLAVIFMGF